MSLTEPKKGIAVKKETKIYIKDMNSHQPVKKHITKVETEYVEQIFNIPVTINSSAALSIEHPKLRLKFPEFKLRYKNIYLALALVFATLAVGITMRQSIVSYISSTYTAIDYKLALYFNPLPKVTQDQLRVKSDSLDLTTSKIDSQDLSLSIGSSVSHPNPTTIKSWYRVVSSRDGYTTIQTLPTAINSYVQKTVTKLTYPAVDQVTVTHPDGSTYTLSSGSNGQKFPSANLITGKLESSLLNGNGLNLSLPAIVLPYKTTNQPDQSQLIEVDVVTKRMYAYQNGQLIRTFLVTAGAPDTPTPIGTFHIWEKLREQTMTGFNPNGTKYVQPNVQWINYFDHSGDAIHGNYWRPLSYFGNINSSHGCVGVVNSDALWIYNWAPIGTTIVIHR